MRWHDHNCFWFWDLVKHKQWCFEEQNTSAGLVSFCVQNQLTQSSGVKASYQGKGVKSLPFCLEHLQKSWQQGLLCKETNWVPFAIENYVALWCHWDQIFKDIQDCNRSCSPQETKCVISPRENWMTNFQGEIFCVDLATPELKRASNVVPD